MRLRKKTRMRALALVVAGLLSVCLLAGCGRSGGSASASDGGPFIYYLNEDDDGLVREPYQSTGDLSVETLLGALADLPVNPLYEPLLGNQLRVKTYSLTSGLLILDFDEGYSRQELTREVLVRAGIVRTMVQAEGVSKVAFTIEGREAVTPGGVTLGAMDANSFVEDAGRQINSIQNQKIRLYYADESGKVLNVEGRNIYYSSSKPLEWAIVERVIAGPKDGGNYPTLPSNTQIISVTSSNGICFVNLNRAFTEMALAIDPALPVYSIVNALVDNCDSIESVQISVEGESNIRFRDSIDLSKPLQADHSIVAEAVG